MAIYLDDYLYIEKLLKNKQGDKGVNYSKCDNGFTLIEVLAVIIIIGVLGAIAIPKLMLSTTTARQNADIATAHQVKAALDRYQLETGEYPTEAEFKAEGGTVKCEDFIPKYISKLDASTTQQVAPEGGDEGFGVGTLTADYKIPDAGEEDHIHTIMIYLANDGSAAEVRVYGETTQDVLWSSAN